MSRRSSNATHGSIFGLVQRGDGSQRRHNQTQGARSRVEAVRCRLYLFGSTAHGEAREDSEVDLFFDHPLGSLGLFELMDVKNAAARILGRQTDIMTRRRLHPVLRGGIEASALQVLMGKPSPVPRLTDIIDAIELSSPRWQV